MFRDFPTLSRICIFFLLLFFLLIFLFSLPLPSSAFHLSILSEVWLQNFLRWLFAQSMMGNPINQPGQWNARVVWTALNWSWSDKLNGQSNCEAGMSNLTCGLTTKACRDCKLMQQNMEVHPTHGCFMSLYVIGNHPQVTQFFRKAFCTGGGLDLRSIFFHLTIQAIPSETDPFLQGCSCSLDFTSKLFPVFANANPTFAVKFPCCLMKPPVL